MRGEFDSHQARATKVIIHSLVFYERNQLLSLTNESKIQSCFRYSSVADRLRERWLVNEAA